MWFSVGLRDRQVALGGKARKYRGLLALVCGVKMADVNLKRFVTVLETS